MRVLFIPCGKKPEVREIDGSLESMQQLVGGLIQAVYPFDDPVALICNDEGKLLGLPFNRALRNSEGEIYDINLLAEIRKNCRLRRRPGRHRSYGSQQRFPAACG